jgi:diguanylate cyclase (GGDEF)-like protein
MMVSTRVVRVGSLGSSAPDGMKSGRAKGSLGMASDRQGAPPGAAQETAGPLGQALRQNEQVQDLLRRAAADLSSLTALLKHDVGSGRSGGQLQGAVDQSEPLETLIDGAAVDLALVNDALMQQIDDCHDLERRLVDSGVALSQSRIQERRSRRDALHDAATGLPNMSLFLDRVSNALAQARRHTRAFAVLFLDLDEFKAVNDTYGHHIGDSVLQIIAERLETGLRGGDTASRRGGDEFVVLLMEISDESESAAFATRLRDRISEPCQIGGVTLIVKPSIGIATYPGDGHSAEELIRNSDVAMYAAKKAKKGSLRYRELSGSD